MSKKPPKKASEMTSEELAKRVFPKEVVKDLKHTLEPKSPPQKAS